MKLRETARNSSKAEMNEKLVGKSGSFGRFKQNNSTKETKKEGASDGERTNNVTKRLFMRRARMDERDKDDGGSSSSSGQRWGSF